MGANSENSRIEHSRHLTCAGRRSKCRSRAISIDHGERPGLSYIATDPGSRTTRSDDTNGERIELWLDARENPARSAERGRSKEPHQVHFCQYAYETLNSPVPQGEAATAAATAWALLPAFRATMTLV